MKIAFRILVIVLLCFLVFLQLRNNKIGMNETVAQAERKPTFIPVRVMTPKWEVARKEIELVGTVESENDLYVISKSAGTITKLAVRVGTQVSAGDLIASIDDFYAQEEYDIALKQYEQVKKDYDRYLDLSKENAVTGQQLEQVGLQLEGAKTKVDLLKNRLADSRVTAPIDGVINQLLVKRGATVGQGTPICEISGTVGTRVVARLPFQKHIVKTGDEAILTSTIYPDQVFKAKVTEVGVKPTQFGGVPLVLHMSEEIAPGSLVNIQLNVGLGKTILIPSKAITRYNGQTGVFFINDSLANFMPITYEDFDENNMAVSDSSFQNKQIVVEGNYLLNSMDKVKVVAP